MLPSPSSSSSSSSSLSVLLFSPSTELKRMDKAQEQAAKANNTLLWDCGSSLYDSFELKSFKRQLDNAIAARSFSMPRFNEPAQQQPPRSRAAKKPFRFSRSIHRLIRSVFRLKPSSGTPVQAFGYMEPSGYGLRPGSGGLATIPEATERGVDSPEVDPMVRKTMSERFTSATATAATAAAMAAQR